MAKAIPEKRNLTFHDFDGMFTEIDSLLQNGYRSNGNWTLGQVCGHVADWMRFPMDGYPKPPLFVRAMFKVMNMTGMTKKMANKILEEGFSGGTPTAPETIPAETFTDQEGVAKLRKTVDQLNEHTGDLLPSPLFGEVDKAKHVKVCLLHAQHHFGYLNPKTN